MGFDFDFIQESYSASRESFKSTEETTNKSEQRTENLEAEKSKTEDYVKEFFASPEFPRDYRTMHESAEYYEQFKDEFKDKLSTFSKEVEETLKGAYDQDYSAGGLYDTVQEAGKEEERSFSLEEKELEEIGKEIPDAINNFVTNFKDAESVKFGLQLTVIFLTSLAIYKKRRSINTKTIKKASESISKQVVKAIEKYAPSIKKEDLKELTKPEHLKQIQHLDAFKNAFEEMKDGIVLDKEMLDKIFAHEYERAIDRSIKKAVIQMRKAERCVERWKYPLMFLEVVTKACMDDSISTGTIYDKFNENVTTQEKLIKDKIKQLDEKHQKALLRIEEMEQHVRSQNLGSEDEKKALKKIEKHRADWEFKIKNYKNSLELQKIKIEDLDRFKTLSVSSKEEFMISVVTNTVLGRIGVSEMKTPMKIATLSVLGALVSRAPSDANIAKEMKQISEFLGFESKSKEDFLHHIRTLAYETGTNIANELFGHSTDPYAIVRFPFEKTVQKFIPTLKENEIKGKVDEFFGHYNEEFDELFGALEQSLTVLDKGYEKVKNLSQMKEKITQETDQVLPPKKEAEFDFSETEPERTTVAGEVKKTVNPRPRRNVTRLVNYIKGIVQDYWQQ